MLAPLHEYQERAIQEALSGPRYEAIDMGLGKTRIALEITKRLGLHATVLAPLIVAEHAWPQEIKKWTPDITYAFIHGPKKEMLMKLKTDIRLLNYDGIPWMMEYGEKHGLSRMQGQILFLDESTFIKSWKTARWKHLKRILPFFKYVFCLSGTPMPNGYINLWTQYFCLDGGKRLGRTVSSYGNHFFHPVTPPYWKYVLKEGASEQIDNRVADITTVLRGEDYLHLPPITYTDIPISLPAKAYGLYTKFRKQAYLELSDDHSIRAINAGVKNIRLRQIIQGGVYKDDKTYTIIHTAKAEMVKTILQALDGDPAIITINFKLELELLQRVLRRPIPFIAGGVQSEERHRLLSLWGEGKLPFLAVQPMAFARGINMQSGGRNIIWMGLTYDLEVYQQLNARLHRQGQTKPVNVMHIVAQNTVESKIAPSLREKGMTQDKFKSELLRILATA